MALGREVHHHIRVLLLEQFVHGLAIRDACLHKTEIRVIHDRRQGGQVACVGQAVQTDDAVVRILVQHVKDKVASDKSAPPVTIMFMMILLLIFYVVYIAY